MELQQLATEIQKIAREAGATILDIYDSSADFGITSKKDHSPLTKADKASNDIICAGLEKLDIGYPIISEENKEIPFEERRHFEYYWLVDPLDGTKEFIKRNGEFTVNIALVHWNTPVMGIVYAPVLDQMFTGIKGSGAFLKEHGEAHKIKTADFRLKDPGLGVVCSRSHLNDATQKFVDDLDKPELVSVGSSLKFLILAMGVAHVYPRLAPTMEWDTAAAQVVLEEAGGKVVRADNNEALRYNKEDLLNPYFIAYGNVE
ncbi:MAG: 3'(2'),5'-bisphosphate nucleotidase CysQ [Bacteroidota bacterium]